MEIPVTQDSASLSLVRVGARIPMALLAIMGAILYRQVLAGLWSDWMNDPGASYGVIIPPFALFVAWSARHRTLRFPAVPDSRGLVAIGAACLMYVLGQAAAEFFLARCSIVLMLGGLVWTFWGLERLRTLLFPLLLLLTMIPLPALIYNPLGLSLQLLATMLSGVFLEILGYTISIDGNIILLPHISLGVAEACSGLRSLPSFVVAGIILAFLKCHRRWTQLVVILMTIPVAIGMNIIRITATAMLAEHNEQFAKGFYHSFSGWLAFVVGLLFLWFLVEGLHRLRIFR